MKAPQSMGMTTLEHSPCSQWTIKFSELGVVFYISHINLKDVAESMAKGLRIDNPKAEVTVYFAEAQYE